MPKRKTDFEWLKDQLDGLLSIADGGVDSDRDVMNEYGLHSGLKLAGLKHAIEVFTSVAPEHAGEGHRFSSSVYIDLFAGAGRTTISKREHLPGSPIVASHSPKPFDRFILVEKKLDRCQALEGRLRNSGVDMSKVILHNEDCNAVVGDIIKEAKFKGDNPIVFVCVDPEGMEINWATLERISDALPRSDFFIVFTGGTQRVVNAHVKRGTHGESLRNFTGIDAVENLALAGKSLFDVYRGRIQGHLGKSVGDSVPITDVRGQEKYKILLFVRPTYMGTRFFRGYSAMFSRLNGVGVEDVRHALNILKGGQDTLKTAQ